MQLPDLLSRRALVPSLRLVRDHLAAHPDYREVRKWAARADRAAPRNLRDARITAVPIGDVQATWIDAKGARRNRAILYLHGGAFIAETPALHSALAARIGAQARARVLMPSYRLAPEFPYPAGLDDCLASYRFLLDNGFAAERLTVVGDSAGGNLTLSLLLRARAEGLPLPAGAVVLSPATDGTLGGDSIRRNAGHDAMFAPALFDALLPLYLPDERLRTHPHVSPLLGDLDGLPPILMMVGSTELLLDDSVRFASRCRSATLEVWHGMPHVFPLFEFLPEATDATQRIGRFLRECITAAKPRGGAMAGDEADDVVAEAAAGAADRDRSARAVASDAVDALDGTRAPEMLERPGGEQTTPDSAARVRGWPPTDPSFTPRAALYLVLALLAALAAVAPYVIGSSPAGTPLPGLLAALLPGAGRFSLETWLGTATLIAFAHASTNRIGRLRAATVVLGALIFGVACGLALLLFERERQRSPSIDASSSIRPGN